MKTYQKVMVVLMIGAIMAGLSFVGWIEKTKGGRE